MKQQELKEIFNNHDIKNVKQYCNDYDIDFKQATSSKAKAYNLLKLLDNDLTPTAFDYDFFSNEVNVTFKKEKACTGLMAMACPYQNTDIFINGFEIGTIFEQDRKIKFRKKATEEDLAKNPNCPWVWVQLKIKPDTVKEAKELVYKRAYLMLQLACQEDQNKMMNGWKRI